MRAININQEYYMGVNKLNKTEKFVKKAMLLNIFSPFLIPYPGEEDKIYTEEEKMDAKYEFALLDYPRNSHLLQIYEILYENSLKGHLKSINFIKDNFPNDKEKYEQQLINPTYFRTDRKTGEVIEENFITVEELEKI